MKIGVLTSSRADYSIYKPLLEQIRKEKNWELGIIVFGTHLSEKYGMTVQAIKNDGFAIDYCLDTMPEDDQPASISSAMGKTIQHFSEVWKNASYDWVIALGDRYEMFAAVAASLPFNIRIAHLHGGETTLGAIDNAFRHSISHMAKLHFVAAEPYRKRLAEILGNEKNIYNTGALSIDNLSTLPLYTTEEFFQHFHIDLKTPTILITFHPETISFEKNEDFSDTIIESLREVKDYQYLVTMPNADTMGLSIRQKLITFAEKNNRCFLLENLGTVGYLSAMKHCSFMLGNTSSGFIEAAFFPKWVINLGDRQKGRILTSNILQTDIDKKQILEAIQKIQSSPLPARQEIYGDGKAAEKIVHLLKEKS
ncbi:MAG TPA: UDP-N-acetylglucosamine 2-epimerase [Cytophagaceae bacterium]|jgi:GDP/UDP-N,N'-diacetylbacillosamine 2-epimerase (hydrolysing)|nr:UDP-N-acetylglucosamine 2-epimerase [Cytophagaceae bacterium]